MKTNKIKEIENKSEYKKEEMKEKKYFNDLKIYFSFFLKYIYILLIIILIYSFTAKYRYQKIKNNIQNGIIESYEIKKKDENELKDILVKHSKIDNEKDSKEKEDINKKRKQLLDKYGIEENFLKDEENIYKKDYIKDIIIFSNIFLIIYIIYILLIYKKEKEVLRDIKDVRKIIEDNLKGKIYFNSLKFNENEKSIEKSLINKNISNIFKLKSIDEKNKKNIEEFISDIAHQLRVPISNIKLKIFLIKNKLENNKENEESFKKIQDIENEINKISFLIEELLKMARLDSKAINFKKEEVKYNEFIEKILENFKYLIELKNVKIVFEKQEEILNIDKIWTEEAVGNILKNAIEHTKEQNKIYIYLQKTAIYKRIVIKDEGEGMEKEEIKNVFKRFYKGKNSDKKSIGIGINIAKKIIEEQGGFIDVKSEKGKGSEFRINILR